MLKILKIQKISKIRKNTENIEITQSHFTFQGHFTFQSHFTFQAILPFKTILHFKFQISGNQERRNAKQEETFVRRVESLAAAAGRKWETINAGVSGISLKNELAILQETGLALEPNIVLTSEAGFEKTQPRCDSNAWSARS